MHVQIAVWGHVRGMSNAAYIWKKRFNYLDGSGQCVIHMSQVKGPGPSLGFEELF